MEISSAVSFWIGITGTLIGIIGTGIAIYQWAVLNETNKRKSELQYILAGINNAALQKQVSWQNQMNTLHKFESAQDWEMERVYLKAKDDMGEIASLAIALEGAINIEESAIGKMMDKSIEMVRKNNELQSEGLKNPTLKPQVQDEK
jgi:hypothetical protein